MTDKIKNILIILLTAAFVFGLFFGQLLSPAKELSASERRTLAAFPTISSESILSGKFMQKFEDYAMDQFPLRDSFRTVKAVSARSLFLQKAVNDLYLTDGYLSKLEYPLDLQSIRNAADKFNKIYDKYLKENNTDIYLSIVPDKNYFLAEQNNYPSMDYHELVNALTEQCAAMQYIDIFDLLDISDYYKTDTHWRQEKIADVAEKIAAEMGTRLHTDYEQTLLDKPFFGVYYGQAALPLAAEELYYMNCAELDACTVFDHETDTQIGIYDMDAAYGKDPYEIFLSGSKALLTIHNPTADNTGKLIVFRDSFGSSIAPYFATGYSDVILIDIRYLASERLGNMVDFSDCDVLFIYSTLVLNNSITLK